VSLLLEGGEAVEDGLLEGDAVVGVRVVGVHVDLLDLGVAGLLERGEEGVVGWGEAVVGGDDEDGAGGELRCEVDGVPGVGVDDDLFCEAGGSAAGEWRHAFGGEAGGDGMKGEPALIFRDGLQLIDAHVGGGDEADGFDGGVVGGDVAGHEAAHAVADEDDVGGVGAETLCVGRVAHVGDSGLGVFDGVGEGEVAGRAPGAAIVEVENVPSGAADGLGEVEILLVAGEAVEEDDDGMRACSGGDVDEGVEHGSVAGKLEALHGGGIGLVGCGVGGKRGGSGLRVECGGAEERGCGEYG